MSDQNLTRFAWLADAPLFIDAPQIDRFYDAVVRPTYVEGASSVTVGSTGELTFGGEVSGKGKLSIGGGLLKMLTGAGGEAELGGKATTGKKDASSEARQTQWLPIRTPQRQLGQLILNYNAVAPERLLEYGPTSDAGPLYDPATVAMPSRPRAVVILDLPGLDEAKRLGRSATRLFPMAAELTGGGVALLYQQLRQVQVQKMTRLLDGGDISKLDQMLTAVRSKTSDRVGHPAAADGAELSSAEREQRAWELFAAHFDPWDAMKVLEDTTGQQRIRWIDFQLACTLTAGRKNIHMHVCPGGEFDTGVFGYNFIFRAYLYGIRLVATLKAGPDLNILAIYEK